jgi:NAD(P)-dependent dehydrogenase (short-subunit alcohol dehydrogenase family)
MSGLLGGTAVVTGAGSGLGAAMAGAFAAEGMAVVALDINREAAESVAAALEAGGTAAIGRAVDVADRETLDAAAAEVAARFGSCNVLAANVGVMQFGPLERITADDWQWLLSVNVVGTANTVNAFLPLLPRTVRVTSCSRRRWPRSFRRRARARTSRPSSRSRDTATCSDRSSPTTASA